MSQKCGFLIFLVAGSTKISNEFINTFNSISDKKKIHLRSKLVFTKYYIGAPKLYYINPVIN